MRHLLLSLLRVFVLLPSYGLVLLVRLIKWLIAPPLLLLQLLFGTPLALWRVRHQPLRPRFVPVQEVELPDAAWLALTDAAESLAAAGFTRCNDFRSDDLIQDAWLRLLAQSEQGSGALIAHIQFVAGSRPPHDFVEFSTQLQDGRVLATNNLNLPYSLPPPAYMARLQLKDVWDPRALYALHRRLLNALKSAVDPNPAARAVRDPAGLLADGYTREIQALIGQGWLRADRDGGAARLRLRAAAAGVWRQAWPLASLYLRAADRHARRVLASHGIDASAFAGGATAILVDRQPLPAETVIATARAGYPIVRPVAQDAAPRDAGSRGGGVGRRDPRRDQDPGTALCLLRLRGLSATAHPAVIQLRHPARPDGRPTRGDRRGSGVRAGGRRGRMGRAGRRHAAGPAGAGILAARSRPGATVGPGGAGHPSQRACPGFGLAPCGRARHDLLAGG